MKFTRIVFCTLACVMFFFPNAGAIEPEDGPAFMTDSHGAAAVSWFLREIRSLESAYDRYYFGGLDWLVTTALWEGDMCGWWISTTAPEGHPNHRLAKGGSAIKELTQGWLASGNVDYRDTALGGVRGLLERAIPVPTPYGQGYWWGERVGHSHGPGSYGGTLLSAYEDLEGAADLVYPYIVGLLNWLVHQAVWGDDGQGNPTAFWPEQEGGTAYETGYCYGNAGTLAFVIDAARQFPIFTFPVGSPVSNLRELANASARWLISVAVELPVANGLYWPYMRHDEYSDNVGWGSGVAGIGAQFLYAYQLNQAAGDPFASECLDTAKKAANTVVYKVSQVTSIQRGACGGEGGAPLFLMDLADEIEITDPQLALECRDASKAIGEFIVADRLTFYKERTAWQAGSKFGNQAVNIAFDYGATGLGLALYVIGSRLDREDLVGVAQKAVEYLQLITVWDEQAGCKWPQIIPYGPVDTDGDGVYNEWDTFPSHPDDVVDFDGDGMGDNFEWKIIDHDPGDPLESFSDVLPGDDYDGDGHSNLKEFNNKTDPTDPDSYPPCGTLVTPGISVTGPGEVAGACILAFLAVFLLPGGTALFLRSLARKKK